MKPRKRYNEDTFADRWSDEVMAMGFFMKPVCLSHCLDALGLKAQEGAVLDSLFAYWYDYTKPSNVYPATATIAKQLGLANSSVGRLLRSLERKGFIEREYRTGTTNVYHLMPTILKVRDHVMSTHPAQKRGGYYSNMGRQPPPYLMSKEEPVIRRPNQNNLKKIGDILNERIRND